MSKRSMTRKMYSRTLPLSVLRLARARCYSCVSQRCAGHDSTAQVRITQRGGAAGSMEGRGGVKMISQSRTSC